MKSRVSDAERRIVGEDAAKWLFELCETGPADRAAFVAWLKESPRHVEEFLFATATISEVRDGAKRDSPDAGAADDEVRRLIAQALAKRTDDTVVPLADAHTSGGSPAAQQSRAPAHWGRTRWTLGIAASVVALALGVLAVPALLSLYDDRYATAVGEQRSVKLADGSVVYLNARSRIEVDYSEAARDVRLIEGEAIFKVEHDPTRAFRVRTEDALIQALGTQFNVYRKPEGTTVAVLEGTVRVSSSEPAITLDSIAATELTAAERPSPAQVNLTAGEQTRIGAGGIIEQPARADLSQVVAWRERRLVFSADRLASIADEFSRYSPRRIRLEDEIARNKRITGTFDADDPESLVLFLEKLDELTVVREGEDFLVSARK